MNENQIKALVNYPYPLVRSLRMGANDVRARFDELKFALAHNTKEAISALRASAAAASADITQKTEFAINTLRASAAVDSSAVTVTTEAAIAALRRGASTTGADLHQQAEKALWDMRTEYAQQVKEANRILAGEQEPYDIDHSQNQIL